MIEIPISDLVPVKKLERSLYHASGEELFRKEDELTGEMIGVLREAKVERLVAPSLGESPAVFRRACKHTTMSVKDLRVGDKMSRQVIDRDGRLLIEAGTTVTESLSDSLARRGIAQIYVRKTGKVLGLEQLEDLRRRLRGLSAAAPESVERLPKVDVRLNEKSVIDGRDVSVAKVEEALDSDAVRFEIVPEGVPLESEIKPPPKARSTEEKKTFLDLQWYGTSQTRRIFDAFARNRDIDGIQIGKLCREVISGLIRDRTLLINVANLKTPEEYIVGHTLSVTILAINIGASLAYNKQQVLELAYSAFLQDIGMLKVPRDILEKPGRLSTAETLEVRKHTIYGIDFLQKIRGIPYATPFVVYQAHEREDGSGYPKGRRGRIIHDFARIVAVADVFDAMTSERPYRQAMLPYSAMEELIIMGSRRQLDPRVIKAFLRCVSLFPIGSWLELEGGAAAKAVALNSQDYARPVVSVFTEGGKRLPEFRRIDLAKETEIKIVRAIGGEALDADAMDGF